MYRVCHILLDKYTAQIKSYLMYYMKYQVLLTRATLAVSARGCIVERDCWRLWVMRWSGRIRGWESSWTAVWAAISEYAREGTTSFMTLRALRCSPTLSQSCRGHKVNIRHQRAARVTAFPVSILPHPSFPSLFVPPFGTRNTLALVGSPQSVLLTYRRVIEKSW